jgi:sterol desaturase/sphingolipid hydroxylase (fatty acid hydroxylase superfamily)
VPGTLPEALFLSLAIGLCIAAGLVMAVEEWRWMKSRGALTATARREMALSFGMLVPNIPATLLMGGAWSGIYVAAYQAAPLHIGANPLVFLLAFLAADLSYYWEHRCAHLVPWLWRLYHAPHHSSPDYTVATAYRVSFLNQLLAPAFYIPWILLGMPPLLVLGFQFACFHYQAWLHTEMIGPLGVWDRVFNTPANHRIHHSTDAAHRDRNFGAVLMVWDRIFGTYAPPAPSLAYGLAGEIPPRNAWEIYAKPWRRRASSSVENREEATT